MDDIQITRGEINTTPVSKKSFNKLYLGIGIGVGVLIIGFVVVFATGIWNPFQANPLNMLESSFSRLDDLDYFHLDVDADIDITEKGDKVGLEYRYSMDIDNDPDIPKSKLDLAIGIITQGVKMVISGDIISVGDVAYMRLRGVPILIQIQLTGLGIDINQYANKWYHFDPAELGMDFDVIDVEFEKALEDLTDKYSLIKFVKNLDSEVINNEDTFHYLFKINEDDAQLFILDFFELVEDQIGGLPINDPSPDEMYEELGALFETIGPIEFETWIGKSTHVLYRFRFKKDLDIEGTTINANIEFNISELNVPNEINAPAGSESLIELFMPIIEMFTMMQTDFGEAPARANDARIKSDINQARTYAELLWADTGSYDELCFGDILNKAAGDYYGDKLESIKNDITDRQGGILTMHCQAGEDNYCISAQLASNPMTYFCVDSDGRVEEVDKNVCTSSNMTCQY